MVTGTEYKRYLNNIQHNLELTKDQDFVFPLKEFSEKSVENHHLSTCVDELFSQDKIVSLGIDWPVEQKWMRTDFTELHNSILEFHIINLANW